MSKSFKIQKKCENIIQVTLMSLIMQFLQENEYRILQRTYEFYYLISFSIKYFFVASINNQKSRIILGE